ncbi:ABC transporter permease [Paracoccus lutimaris]|uniref:Monosaccharide ABC transporter membrane protein (CUT2 family) n=1 Tax=Paracoccus lutimaris TaxID=1490030 RepID=A0A368Z5J3_9RHOB|nr:ABC transporter permease [Paracoccus lutimaris]RCW87239.1 monosaccharide ABC transporter membrane protein (CUT2 family) [Paracoccus lutimaris]
MTENAASFNEAGTRRRFGFGRAFRQYGTFVIFVLLILVAQAQSDAFLTERNMMNVLRQMSGIGVMAIGMLFVILTRGIDLSVGSIAALGSVATAILVKEYPLPLALVLVVGMGAACGLISGIFIAFFRLPAFVITLAMMTAARGFALILSNGQPITLGAPGKALQGFGTSFTLGVPNPALLMIALFALAFVVLNYSRFGRLVKAIGSNEEAVRLSGISVPWYVLSVYVISGALSAVAGVLVTSRSGVGSASVGDGNELDVIAAVVIGGASLMGGVGGVINTFIGVLILGVIGNIMNLAGVPGYHQQVYLGVIIVAAVLIQNGSTLLRR